MTGKTLPSTPKETWALAARQHGVLSRRQLVALGFTRHAIAHRVAQGRLHPVWPGVFAVGRPELTAEGRWMAAVLACGPGAVLSHLSAAVLWRIVRVRRREIDVSVPRCRSPKPRPGIAIHRRTALGEADVTSHCGVPVTTPIATLVDIAPSLHPRQLEAAINEADKLNLTDPDRLRAALDAVVARPGTANLRRTLDARTFVLTDSDLERRFLRLARQAGLPLPQTQAHLQGFKVDFHWPDLGLVVETDGLRYHRTPAEQANDRVRDQVLTAAGLTVLRFTHGQIASERGHVRKMLAAVAR